MSSTFFKQFIKKAILSKQGPPGPPPRPGLKWKPQTHRWIIDQSASQHSQTWPKNHPVHENIDTPYLTSDKTGAGFDLHEGQEVTYEAYPIGQNIPGVVKHDDEEGWVIEATGEWKQHFDDTETSDYIKLGGDEGTTVSTNLSEFNQVKEDIDDISDFIDSGEKHNWQGDALLDTFQDRLDAVGKKIGYDSYETTQAGGQGETPLEALLDQLNGALESQQAFGGPQAGSWSDLKANVENYASVNTPSDPADWADDDDSTVERVFPGMGQREYDLRTGELEERIGDKMEDIITDAMKDIQDDFGGRQGELSNEAMESKLREKLAFHYTTGADTNVFPHEEIAEYLKEDPYDIADYFNEFDITNYHTPSKRE